jgi:hypothetical protein
VSGVCVPAEFTYLFADGRQVPLRVELKWSPEDPFAVEFRFVEDAKSWWVSRELLVAALTSARAGDGDVQFWSHEECPDVVGVDLESPDGYAELLAPREALIDLLMATENRSDAVDPFTELDDVWLPEVLAG